jgi:isopropylmalate/homocitrate/citramalate synthase
MTAVQQRNIVNRLVAEQVARQAQKWRSQTAQQVYAVILIILHDKYEFKPEQLKRVIEEITEKFDCIADKYVKIEDFYELLEEIGIEVTE